MDFLDELDRQDAMVVKALLEKKMDDSIIKGYLSDDRIYKKYLRWKQYRTFMYDLPDLTCQTIQRLIDVSVDDEVMAAFLNDDTRFKLYKEWKKSVSKTNPSVILNMTKKTYNFKKLGTYTVHMEFYISPDCIDLITQKKSVIEATGVQATFMGDLFHYNHLNDRKVLRITGDSYHVSKAENKLYDIIMSDPAVERRLCNRRGRYSSSNSSYDKLKKILKKSDPFMELKAMSDAVGIVVGRNSVRKSDIEMKTNTYMKIIRDEDPGQTTIRIHGKKPWFIAEAGLEVQRVLANSVQFAGVSEDIPLKVFDMLMKHQNNMAFVFNFERETGCFLAYANRIVTVKGWSDQEVKHAIASYEAHLNNGNDPDDERYSIPSSPVVNDRLSASPVTYKVPKQEFDDSMDDLLDSMRKSNIDRNTPGRRRKYY